MGRREVGLRPKAFEILRCLAEKPQILITKDELFESVWRTAVVSDDTLTQCLSELRAAIGDRDRTVIKTVPRRGYVLAVNVVREPSSAPQPNLASFAGPSVAVVPFVNLSSLRSQEFFCDGITEDIVTELSRFSELLVIDSNSSFQFKERTKDVRQIGRELGVGYVLKGSVRRQRNSVRVAAQLVDAASGLHRWGASYDRKLTDLFAVQDEIARSVASTIVAHMSKCETDRALLKPPKKWGAYEACLMAAAGFSLWRANREAAHLYEIRRRLRHALSLDPNYARAHAMLALRNL